MHGFELPVDGGAVFHEGVVIGEVGGGFEAEGDVGLVLELVALGVKAEVVAGLWRVVFHRPTFGDRQVGQLDVLERLAEGDADSAGGGRGEFGTGNPERGGHSGFLVLECVGAGEDAVVGFEGAVAVVAWSSIEKRTGVRPHATVRPSAVVYLRLW